MFAAPEQPGDPSDTAGEKSNWDEKWGGRGNKLLYLLSQHINTTRLQARVINKQPEIKYGLCGSWNWNLQYFEAYIEPGESTLHTPPGYFSKARKVEKDLNL